jgi:hypothetical protein
MIIACPSLLVSTHTMLLRKKRPEFKTAFLTQARISFGYLRYIPKLGLLVAIAGQLGKWRHILNMFGQFIIFLHAASYLKKRKEKEVDVKLLSNKGETLPPFKSKGLC